MKKLAVICCAAFAALGSFSVFGTAVVPENFAKKITISLSDDAKTSLGEESLTDFPIPVRLSTAITHFDYSDFRCAGEDIAFADEEGNALEFELDTWNTDGESLYWVKIPSLVSTTILTCYYGAPAATVHDPKLVWTSYAAVIHGGQSLKDSSTNQLAVTANATTLTDSAVVGGGIAKAENKSIGVNLANPYNVLKAYNKFSVLGWYKRVGNGGKSNGTHIMAGARNSFGASGGFLVLQEAGKYISVAAQSSHQWSSGKYTLRDQTWDHFAFTYEHGGKLISYYNGAKDQEKSSPGQMYATISQAANWTFGSYANAATEDSFKGEMDELRVYDGIASALWVTNEYAFAADNSRVVVGSAQPVDEDAVILAADPTIEKTANGFRMTAALDAKSPAADLYAIYGGEYPFVQTNLIASAVAGGASASGVLPSVPTNVMCHFGVFAVNASVPGKTAERLGESGFLNGVVTIAKTRDAEEIALSSPGQFTVSRPSTATDGALVVPYSVGGTAVAGTHYVALSGTVTIPDGEVSATINVYAKIAASGDHTVTVTLGDGLFLTESATSTATLTIIAFSPSSGFDKKIEYTLSDYSGPALTDFPMLVRLSTTNTADFAYSDFKLPNGGDLRFTTEAGVPLVHEIDTWDPDGDSLVWVKVPVFEKDVKIIAYYGNSDPWSIDNAATWSDYAGVWHMNETTAGTTTIKDASGTSDGTSHSASTASTGVIAGARGFDKDAKSGGLVVVPKTSKLDQLVPSFTISGWVKPHTLSLNWGYLFSRKTADAYASWGLQFRGSSGNSDSVGLYSNGTADNNNNRALVNTASKWTANVWQKYDVVYTASTVALYINGVLIDSVKTVKPGAAVNGVNDFAISGFPTTANHGSLKSDQDEVRLRFGSVSEDWIMVEYNVQRGALTMANEGVKPVDESSIKFALKPTITKSGSVFSVNVSTTADSGVGSITAYYGTNGEYDLSDVVESAATASGNYSAVLTHLDSDKSYKVSVWGENAKGTITKSKGDETLFNGELSAVKTRDADEASLANPGLFTVTRADSYGDLVVNYTTGGDAVAGTDYEELSGAVTIPDGQTSATIEVHPIRTKTVNHTLTITLTDGLYLLGSSAPTASMTIKALTTPTGYNTWIAEAAGNASVAANWSEGRVPLNTDNILIDARYSNASMTWDAGENGLPATVASWTQSYNEGDAEYSGTVTFKTVYPGKGEFTCFTVSGACVINCGTWTHPQSRTMGDNHNAQWDWLADLKANETYRLRLACGSLSVGSKGSIDVKLKGYYASHDSARCYAAHGGTTRSSAKTYDDPKEPIHIGLPHRTNGGYYNGKGGGAIYITVTGDAVVNGAICADSGNTGHGAGAAGSVYLKANAVTGTGSITARGSATGEGNYKGTGGRVAIITETAVNRATFTAISAEAEWKNAQNGQATEYGGAGTVFFKDSTMTNGKLVIAPKSDLVLNWGNSYRMPVVSTDGDWTFDSIEFGRNGLLIIPAGTTLHLPGGLASCSGTAASSSVAGGIFYDGGTLDLGSATDQTISGNLMLFANSNLTLNANVTVTGGAVIGVPEYGNIMEEGSTLPTFPACKVTVNGNLTIDSTGKLKAEKCGFRKNWNSTEKGLTGYDTHGGRTLAFGKTLKLHYQGYDSIFNPCLPGCTVPHTNGQGVGNTASALDITVTGTLTANGPISATAIYEGAATHNNGAGPGGAIKITTGALVGSGSISADGACNAGNACGGGGRIAVRLTNPGATFAGFSGSIIASGRLSSATALNNSSSAGTVYLQTAAEGEKYGTIRIANRMVDKYYHAANSNTTEMASLGYGGDDVKDYRRANYVIADYGRAAVNTNMTVRSLTLADVNSHLDLEGNTLTLAKFVYVTSGGTSKLNAGEYSLADLASISGLNVYDSSVGQTGKIIVRPRGLAVMLR